MHGIEFLPDEPCAITCGVFRVPYHDSWCAILEVDGEAYDLGIFATFEAAGEAYLKTKLLLEGVS